MTTNKVKMIDVKDYLIQLAGGRSWADSGMPYAFGSPKRHRKKVVFFLESSAMGTQFFAILKDGGYRFEEQEWKKLADFYFALFLEATKFLDMTKYGFNNGCQHETVSELPKYQKD
jgi:hypothetical protein